MNSVVEKLAAIEREVAVIQPKMAPLTERIADLDQKVAGFAQQLSGIAEESAAVKQDIELTRQSLARIQTLIGESKVESEQLVAGQAENLQRCETMTAVFGAAFQAVSQFFETAQRMGLADQAKAVFLHPSGEIPPPLELEEPQSEEPAADCPLTTKETEGLPPPLDSEFPQSEPQSEDGVNDAVESTDGSPPTAEETEDLPSTLDSESPQSEPQSEDGANDAAESTDGSPPTAEESTEPALSEADFNSAMSGTDEDAPDVWSAPGLPDVAAPPDIADGGSDSEEGADPEPSSEIASQLEVPPLNLATPAVSEQDASAPAPDMDDQEIEDLLASMMTPVTATAGN